MNDIKHRIQRGYPLNTLFLLIAACAVVTAMVAPLVRSRLARGIGTGEVVGSIIAGGILLAALGALVGLFHYSRANGVAWGILVGALIGTLFGPALFIAPADFSLVLSTSIGGAALVLAVATAIRLTTDYRRTRDAVGDDLAEPDVAKPKRHPLDPDPAEDEQW